MQTSFLNDVYNNVQSICSHIQKIIPILVFLFVLMVHSLTIQPNLASYPVLYNHLPLLKILQKYVSTNARILNMLIILLKNVYKIV